MEVVVGFLSMLFEAAALERSGLNENCLYCKFLILTKAYNTSQEKKKRRREREREMCFNVPSYLSTVDDDSDMNIFGISEP